MIYTFLRVNSTERYMFYAKDKESSFKELKERLGRDSENWSLISFVEVERFSLITKI